MPENNKELENILDKIQIYSSDDEKLRFLGKMLTNDASRKIFQLISQKEMTANEISNSSDLTLSLVIYHINKMIKADMVSISKNSLNSKNQPMKYYSAKSGIVILPESASTKARASKSFSRSLRSIMKFSAIGLAGFTTWALSVFSSVFSRKISQPDSDDSILEIEPGTLFGSEVSIPIIISLTVIIIGLMVERIWASKFVRGK